VSEREREERERERGDKERSTNRQRLIQYSQEELKTRNRRR